MIRLGKPVQLLEWGKGTNTTNQIWTKLANGVIYGRPKVVDGLTTIAIQIEGSWKKENPDDDSIKIMQQGEGMTPRSDKWGEVAMGRLRSVSSEGGKTVVSIELKGATKFGKLRA
ncbi:MAG TPA: hypothetical protein V6D17_01300 [Candidatus Obscuribacterales bacterium]